MTKTIDVLKAVENYIRENGYDGLCNLDNDGCGCLVDDLAPCGEMNQRCVLGYRGPAGTDDTGEVSWAIFETREGAAEAIKDHEERQKDEAE